MEQPTLQFPDLPKVIFGDSEVICAQWCQRIREQKVTLLGFDIENAMEKPKKGAVCLLQFASRDSVLLVPCLNALPPKCIRDLLQDEKILKAGINIPNDLSCLVRAGHVPPHYIFRARSNKNPFPPASQHGYLDIGIYAQVQLDRRPPGWSPINQNSLHGMASLCASLGFGEHTKDSSLQQSDWAAPVLSEEQRHYAAQDAWISLWLALRALQLVREIVARHNAKK